MLCSPPLSRLMTAKPASFSSARACERLATRAIGTSFECAGRGFGENAVEGRAVPSRHDEAAGAEDGRRPQDRSDVVRVRHLVENDEGTSACGFGEIMPVGFGQGFHVESGALMDRIGTRSLSRSRGETRSIGCSILPTASRRRCSAFSVRRTRRALRAGFFSAASTGVEPEQPNRAVLVLRAGCGRAPSVLFRSFGGCVRRGEMKSRPNASIAPRLVESWFLQGLPRK